MMFEGSPTIEKWEKHGKQNVSKGNSVAAFFPFEMFTGAVKIKHEPLELDLGPLVLTAKCANFQEFPSANFEK